LPVLVIDTCLGACQVALFDGPRRLAAASEAMVRGHQERLAPMAAEVMAQAGVRFDEIDLIAVTVGPGSFTGLRVGLAFAEGLQLATGAPLAGIGTLEALAASAGDEGLRAGVIDARRGQVYWQGFDSERPIAAPDAALADDAAQALAARSPDGWRLIGPGASLLAPFGLGEMIELAAPSLEALGRLALTASPSAEPRPLYLRAPDARPALS
jgi:tRNA threonylcarbamoyladenosine biosynthesis protein TsaB